LLLRGCEGSYEKFSGFCKELCNRPERLWLFISQPGIEPTNNTAEQALRPAVILRKITFGTQSSAESRFQERLMTIVATCRKKRRSPVPFLSAKMKARFNNKKPPSFFPKTPCIASALDIRAVHGYRNRAPSYVSLFKVLPDAKILP
jgi:transposase